MRLVSPSVDRSASGCYLHCLQPRASRDRTTAPRAAERCPWQMCGLRDRCEDRSHSRFLISSWGHTPATRSALRREQAYSLGSLHKCLPRLISRDVLQEFHGFVAVNGVDVRIRRGAIPALIGPNGAGKTTVFNLLTRFLPATAGSVIYRGEDITQLRPAAVARKGLVRSFQISAVF